MTEEFFKENFSAETRAKYTLDQMNDLFERLSILTNFSFVLSDALHSIFLDAETAFNKLDGSFSGEDKHNFNGLKKAAAQGRMFAACLKRRIYGIEEEDSACKDSDDYYYLLKLIEDRTGEDRRKFNMLLEFLLQMPEGGLFKVKFDDFKALTK